MPHSLVQVRLFLGQSMGLCLMALISEHQMGQYGELPLNFGTLRFTQYGQTTVVAQHQLQSR